MPETTETLSLGLDSNPMVAGFRKAGAASRKFADKFQTRMTSISQSARKTGIILSASLTAPIVLMGRSAVKAFQEQEDAVEALRSSLGGASVQVNAITKDFAEYAAQIQQVTVYGDELLISQAAYMKNLGVEETQLKAATKAAVGLAARYRIDLQTAAMLVGRASKGQTQMLTRYGIVMEETLSPQEKFNELLKIGAANFRLAEDAAKTTSGRLKQAANAFGDMKESVGEMIVTGLNFDKVAQKISDSAKSMKGWFDRLSPITKTILSTALLLAAALGPLALGIFAVTFVVAKLSVALVALKGVTLASAGAFAILAAKILLVVAAFKAGQWIGSRIRRIWTNEGQLEKMADGLKKVRTETAKLGKELSEITGISGIGTQGTSMLTLWKQMAVVAKGIAKDVATISNIDMSKRFKVGLHDITRLQNAMGKDGGAGELLGSRAMFQQLKKESGGKETDLSILSRMKVQSDSQQKFVASMDPQLLLRFYNQEMGFGTDALVRAVQALSDGQDGTGADTTASVSSEKASLAVAGSVAAYRAESQSRRADKTEKGVTETASNTAETNKLLKQAFRTRPAYSAVSGIS